MATEQTHVVVCRGSIRTLMVIPAKDRKRSETVFAVGDLAGCEAWLGEVRKVPLFTVLDGQNKELLYCGYSRSAAHAAAVLRPHTILQRDIECCGNCPCHRKRSTDKTCWCVCGKRKGGPH